MQQSFDLLFASSNVHKFQEAKKILEHFGIKLGFYKCNLEEIQSDSLKEIANHKSKQAFQNFHNIIPEFLSNRNASVNGGLYLDH